MCVCTLGRDVIQRFLIKMVVDTFYFKFFVYVLTEIDIVYCSCIGVQY